MKLKTEILFVFLIVGACLTIVTGILYFYNARSIILHSAGNQLESLSAAKKHRIESIISKKEEELRLVQNRLFQNQHLYHLNMYGKLNDTLCVSYRKLITKNIKKLTKEIPSFRNIHVLNKAGVAIASTDTGAINFNFSILDFVQQALAGQNNISSFIDEPNDNAYLCLSAPLYFKGNLQGGILIETTTDDLKTLTGDYTGLGNTGETVIAQLISDSVACFITSTRNEKKNLHKITLNKSAPQAVFLALAGNEKLYLDANDYGNQKIATSCRYISTTQWGIVTKIDMTEILAPAEELKWMSLKIGAGALMVLFVLSFILSSSIVKPINKITDAAKEISQGKWTRRVEINSTNELGDLANSFNKMTDTLVKTQENLELKLIELDRSNTSLEKFAFVVSHDLKSPLNTVLSIIELLGTNHLGTLTEEGRQMLSILSQKVDHMKEMIGGILEFARLGNLQPTTELLDLKQLLLSMAQPLREQAYIEICSDLPKLKMSNILAEQLFQNLFTNAIKYNRSETKKIKVGANRDGKTIVYYVTDNGIGVQENYYDKIFDIFQTVAPKGTDSTGIGLAIVKKIVESYGGKIWVKSTHAEGSTFFFTLPQALFTSIG